MLPLPLFERCIEFIFFVSDEIECKQCLIVTGVTLMGHFCCVRQCIVPYREDGSHVLRGSTSEYIEKVALVCMKIDRKNIILQSVSAATTVTCNLRNQKIKLTFSHYN